MIMFSSITTLLCLYISIVFASPLTKRIVFNPNITSPDASTSWDAGTTQLVTWDTTGLPDDTLKGKVVLGHIEDSDPFNEHLVLDPPLAKDFLLKDGQVSITVPDVASRSDYIVVVFGDSGNASPKFKINNPNNNNDSNSSGTSSGSASPTSSDVTTTPGPLPSTTISDPIPISGTTITGNPSVSDPATVISMTPISTLPGRPSNTPVSTTGTSSASGSQGTSANSNSNNNAAGKLTLQNSYYVLALSVIISLFAF